MKVTLKELAQLVNEEINEAKKKSKKKKKKEEAKPEVQPKGYQSAESLDFSKPLDECNPVAQAVNWGPFTEGLSPDSEWYQLVESLDPKNIWERAGHWYDHLNRGLGNPGKVVPEGEQIDEKYIGFNKLKNQIKGKSGYSDKRAAAVAASIGRKKYGAKGMAQKAAAGRKKG